MSTDLDAQLDEILLRLYPALTDLTYVPEAIEAKQALTELIADRERKLLDRVQQVLRANEDDQFGTNFEGVTDDLLDFIEIETNRLAELHSQKDAA